jgi:hypothetical protein
MEVSMGYGEVDRSEAYDQPIATKVDENFGGVSERVSSRTGVMEGVSAWRIDGGVEVWRRGSLEV